VSTIESRPERALSMLVVAPVSARLIFWASFSAVVAASA
jgi:hypothetical protein